MYWNMYNVKFCNEKSVTTPWVDFNVLVVNYNYITESFQRSATITITKMFYRTQELN